MPASIKVTKFKDTDEAADVDRWKTKGEGIFATGLTIDPDTENVTHHLQQHARRRAVLEHPRAAAGNASCRTTPKLKWKFKDKEADVPGSPSWRKGKFRHQAATRCKFALDGRKTTLFTARRRRLRPMRQTVRVGDVCITAVISCVPKGSGVQVHHRAVTDAAGR